MTAAPPHPLDRLRTLRDLHTAAETVWQAVMQEATHPHPALTGFSVEVLPEVDSTNAELMRRARHGQVAPTLLVAAEQTAGRGRQGKAWHSTAGSSLTLSLGMPLAPCSWAGLSLAVGVSVARSLHPDVQLKWPNDLWWQDHKLGGLLLETASMHEARYAVVGVGLNVLAQPARPVPPTDSAAHPAAAARPAVALSALPSAHAPLSVGGVLACIAPALVRDIGVFAHGGFAAFHAAFDQRDALRGRSVWLSDGQHGVADGVGPDGALWLLSDTQRIAISHQEVSVRPC